MAKTVDELVLKVTAEGTAQIRDTTAAMDNLAASATKTGDSTKQAGGNIRNVAFQVQDLAVQIAGGTSAFVALGQQLPQLLGGFGVLGAVIGAVAAVGIPLFRLGLQSAGIDMRDLNERTKDLIESTTKFRDASQTNLTTLVGLGNQYGSLTEEAKKFFVLQETFTKQKAEFELTSALEKLRKEFAFATDEANAKHKEQQRYLGAYGDYSGVLKDIGDAFKRWGLGLTAEQAKKVSDELKEIDKAKPEEAAKTLNNILTYLKETAPEGSKFRKFFEETVEPLLKINQQIIKQKENINDAAQKASEFNTILLGLQNKFGPDIAAARRNFDQVTAIRKEGELKIAEFRAQTEEKTSKDQVNRSKEVAAFTLRTQQEVSSKIKDVAKAQEEAFNASELTNESKKRVLELETNILSIQDRKRYALAYEVQYEEDLARSRKEQKDSLGSIAEQLRKNVITVDQALILEEQAADIRRRADDNAEKVRQKRKGDAFEAQQAVLFEADARRRVTEFDIESLKVRQQMRQAYPEDIDNAINIRKIKNDQIEAEMKINREMELGKISRDDALQRIGKTKDEMTRLLELEQERTKEAQRYRTASFGEGAQDAVTKIMRDQLTAYQKAGKVVESVYANMGSAIDNFVETGKFKFSDFSRSVINDLIKIQLKADITSVLGAGLKFLGFNIPGRAAGGPVSGNNPYIVGENGPELFIPRTSGNIVPNGGMAMAGGGTSVIYNINAVDTNSFKQLVARDPSFIYAVTEQGRRNIPQVRR
jgi:lambda family phage tail tape measure protein